MEIILAALPILLLVLLVAVTAGIVGAIALALHRRWLANVTAGQYDRATIAQVEADAEATRQKALTESRLLPITAGGSFGFVDIATGLHIPAQINAAVPNALHYAQTITYPALPATPPLAALPAIADDLPGLVDFADTLRTFTPSKDRILLALGAGGELITAPANTLFHIALAGATRNGKSNIMRMILAQLLALRANVYLADPHFAAFDAETGEDWRPIAARLAQPPAYTKEAIEALFMWLALDELPRRLELRRQGQTRGVPIFLAIDELPAIVARIPETSQYLGAILREGAKVGLNIVGASQDFLVKTIGGAGAVRDCYRTAFYVGGDPTSGRVLLDVKGTPDDGTLGKGVVMLRTHTSPAERVRVPLASNESLYALLGGNPAEPQGHAAPTPPPPSPQRPRPAETIKIITPPPTLPADPLTEDQHAALRAYREGATTIRPLAAKLHCGKDTAARLLAELKALGRIV